MPQITRKPFSDSVFQTPLGWFGLVGGARGLRGLTFGHADPGEVRTALAGLPRQGLRAASSSAAAVDWMETAQSLLERYAKGEPVDLTDIPVELPGLTEFQGRVIAELCRVGYGETVSYLELAERAGAPGAARGVGNVMAKNRIPLVLPCHRVIGSAGRLGGYSAPQGLTMKRRLLEMESVGGSAVLK